MHMMDHHQGQVLSLLIHHAIVGVIHVNVLHLCTWRCTLNFTKTRQEEEEADSRHCIVCIIYPSIIHLCTWCCTLDSTTTTKEEEEEEDEGEWDARTKHGICPDSLVHFTYSCFYSYSSSYCKIGYGSCSFQTQL